MRWHLAGGIMAVNIGAPALTHCQMSAFASDPAAMAMNKFFAFCVERQLFIRT